MATLNIYTQEAYKQINKNLRKNRSHEAVEKITEQLQEIVTFRGTVYRGLTLEKSEIHETFRVGRIYRDSGFMSCSRSLEIASKFSCLGVPLSRTEERSITLIIESKTGKNISSFSKYPEEFEVLFAPLTGFQVTSIEVDGWEEYTIILKEI